MVSSWISTMTLHYNTTNRKQRRRFLRSHLPKAEVILWTQLSRHQMLGYKFRRQYGVDQYVIDFYCPKLKLAIEVDGESHSTGTAKVYDRKRQEHIESFGIRFLRVTNSDIFDNLDGVLDEIACRIHEIVLTKSSLHPVQR